jgi:hypothetical protein
MAMDIHPLGARKCFACIQWDGPRTFDQAAKTIRADQGSMGRCLVRHSSIKGSQHCEQFSPLR